MRDASAVLLIYVAVALLYGTSRVRGRARLSALQQPVRRALARAAALSAVGAAMWRWSTAGSSLLAALFVLACLMTLASVVTLLGPVAPRAVWTLALVAAAAAPLLVALGAVS